MKFLKSIFKKSSATTTESFVFSARDHAIIMKAAKELNKIDNINKGGCGISTLALYRYMRKKNIVNHTTHFKMMYTNKRGKFDELRPGCQHVVLCHNGNAYDSEGLVDLSNYIGEYTTRSVYELLDMINNEKWNSAFDRRSNCQRIAFSLGVSLKDVRR